MVPEKGLESKNIIKEALQRCGEIGKRSHINKIANFFNEEIKSEVKVLNNINIIIDNLAVKSNHDNAEDLQSNIKVMIDENYSEEAIYINLIEKNNLQVLSDTIEDYIRIHLLTKFPQYSKVIFRELKPIIKE